MALISELRHGIGTNLATISGLRVSDLLPDQPNPPVAIISLDNVSYDKAFHRGLHNYTFSVLVLVGRVSERTGQTLLDSYSSPTGTASIKLAIESDRTLGGKANDVLVEGMRAYSTISIGDVKYLAAEFVVLCYAD